MSDERIKLFWIKECRTGINLSVSEHGFHLGIPIYNFNPRDVKE